MEEGKQKKSAIPCTGNKMSPISQDKTLTIVFLLKQKNANLTKAWKPYDMTYVYCFPFTGQRRVDEKCMESKDDFPHSAMAYSGNGCSAATFVSGEFTHIPRCYNDACMTYYCIYYVEYYTVKPKSFK